MQVLVLLISFFSLSFSAYAAEFGFNITEEGEPYSYSSALKTDHGGKLIDEAHRLNGQAIIFNIRAHMKGAKTSVLTPAVADIASEVAGIKFLIKRARSYNMKIGLRPIVLVLGPNGEFPYREGDKTWWHGNIRPADPKAWVQAFGQFVDLYLSKFSQDEIDIITLGSELQSMMVGMGDTESAFRIGVPEAWLPLIQKVKAQFPRAAVTYDINFSETNVVLTESVGGEFERWKYGLTELKNSSSGTLQKKHKALVEIWKTLDFIGLDFYRYLARSKNEVPADYNAMVERLAKTAATHATQIDNNIFEIEMNLGVSKKLVIKEIGYKSSSYCFINPASYTDQDRPVNIPHQAGAYQAIANAFIKPNWGWYAGAHLWDLSMTPNKMGPNDSGFSPIGKPLTEKILLENF